MSKDKKCLLTSFYLVVIVYKHVSIVYQTKNIDFCLKIKMFLLKLKKLKFYLLLSCFCTNIFIEQIFAIFAKQWCDKKMLKH